MWHKSGLLRTVVVTLVFGDKGRLGLRKAKLLPADVVERELRRLLPASVIA